MESIWERTAHCPKFDSLEKDISTDILIIGGGMAGILCAFMLQQAGADYVLAEAEEICKGITKNTTAKITAQHGLIYAKLLKNFGVEKAKQYLQANEAAVEQYRKLCSKTDCDFEEKDNFVYAAKDDKALFKEYEALKQLKAPAEIVENISLPGMTVSAVKFPRQAQFHPLKFISEISSDLRIYEHTKVRELIGTTAVTEHGKIKANNIMIATHFPMLNKHGSYFLKLYQQRSYVIAYQNAVDVSGMYVSAAKNGLSFRNSGDLLLLGGGGHRTGKRGGNWQALRAYAAKYLSNAHEVAHWATQDCMSLDGIPYIGAYAASTENLYVATGFNKWGMSSAMVAATLLRDLLQKKSRPYAELFSPSRTILRPQLAINAAETSVNLLTPTKKRCPHLGCALKWNPAEQSWDCPCHGSRFTKDGKLIDNPATGDLPH